MGAATKSNKDPLAVVAVKTSHRGLQEQRERVKSLKEKVKHEEEKGNGDKAWKEV